MQYMQEYMQIFFLQFVIVWKMKNMQICPSPPSRSTILVHGRDSASFLVVEKAEKENAACRIEKADIWEVFCPFQYFANTVVSRGPKCFIGQIH